MLESYFLTKFDLQSISFHFETVLQMGIRANTPESTKEMIMSIIKFLKNVLLMFNIVVLSVTSFQGAFAKDLFCSGDEYQQYGLTNYSMQSGQCWSPEYGTNACNIKNDNTPLNCIVGTTYKTSATYTGANDGWEVTYRCCPLEAGRIEQARSKVRLSDDELTRTIKDLDKVILAKKSGSQTKAEIKVLIGLVATAAEWGLLGAADLGESVVDAVANRWSAYDFENVRRMYLDAQVQLRGCRSCDYAVIGQAYWVFTSSTRGLPEGVTTSGEPYLIGVL